MHLSNIYPVSVNSVICVRTGQICHIMERVELDLFSHIKMLLKCPYEKKGVRIMNMDQRYLTLRRQSGCKKSGEGHRSIFFSGPVAIQYNVIFKKETKKL